MLTVSAPGKVILFGEYAVLHRRPAIVAAVERRATCRISTANDMEVDGGRYGLLSEGKLPFAEALIEPTDQVAHYALDTSAFHIGDHKLGLGSSAASTVALAAAMAAAAGRTIDPAVVFGRAQDAHRAVQGAGSGADVAASAFGGLFFYTWSELGPIRCRSGAAAIQPLSGLDRLLLVDTGQPAHTPTLIEAVSRVADSNRFRARMDQLSLIAEFAGDAIKRRDNLVDHLRVGAESVRDLGRDAGVDLFTEVHSELDAIARGFGGAAKPTGAAGGDLAWLMAPDPDAEAALIKALEERGFTVLLLPIAHQGVRVEAS